MKRLASPDASESNKRFGNALRIARISAGLTQSALAGAVGLERTSITNIESGSQTVTVPTLVKLCEILDVSPAQLVPVESEGGGLAGLKGQYFNMARKILRKSSGSR
jgi:transcriptional regulator with XRE-family HTH domain